MTRKHTIFTTAIVLWVLGVLVGASAADLMPGESAIPSEVVLTVALLASFGNLFVLYRKVE